MEENVLFEDLLKKLNKNTLIKITELFHQYCKVYTYSIAENITKNKKKDIISYLVDKQDIYLKFIIQSLSLADFKKANLKTIKDSSLVPNLKNWGIMINDQIGIDTIKLIKKYTKQKSIVLVNKNNNELYALAKGIIVAYGVIAQEKWQDLLPNPAKCKLLENYYNKEYYFTDSAVVAQKLTNKRKIESYFQNSNLKIFKPKEYIKLGNNLYHHQNKNYKKLIHTLKNNYIFQNSDIMFLDSKVIIPYLYNNRAMEDIALKELNANIDKYFEFGQNKLKNKLIDEIKKIKLDFPMWEY